MIAHDVRSFHPGQVRCLLQHGANPNHTNYMQQSALHLAAVPGAHGSNPGPAGVACDHRPHAKALQGSRAGLPRSLAAPNPGCPSPWLSLTLAAPQPGRPAAWPPLTRARLGCAAGRRTLTLTPTLTLTLTLTLTPTLTLTLALTLTSWAATLRRRWRR